MARKKTPEELEHHVLCENVRELLKTRFGKEFIWFVLSESNINGSIFTGNDHIFYLEGKRSVGLSVLSLMEEADPTAYPRLLLEKQEKKVVIEEMEEDNDG